MSCTRPYRTSDPPPTIPSICRSEIPACELRDEPQDSDSCLQQSSAGAWEGDSCADASYSECTSWAKDMQRCCPEKCGTGALDEDACNSLNGVGVCNYPNEAQCSGKTLPSHTSTPSSCLRNLQLSHAHEPASIHPSPPVPTHLLP